jgi:hypothetical protein
MTELKGGREKREYLAWPQYYTLQSTFFQLTTTKDNSTHIQSFNEPKMPHYMPYCGDNTIPMAFC